MKQVALERDTRRGKERELHLVKPLDADSEVFEELNIAKDLFLMRQLIWQGFCWDQICARKPIFRKQEEFLMACKIGDPFFSTGL
jgi:hypothetical protein